MASFRFPDGRELDLKYTIIDKDRHGNERVYFRKPGQAKVRLLELPGSEAFLSEYRRAAEGRLKSAVVNAVGQHPCNSISWLFLRYFQSAEYKSLGQSTQRVRRLILGHIAEVHGNKPYNMLETKHIRRMRDLRANKPESANGQVKALRAVFAWASSPGVELATNNPAAQVPYIPMRGDGHHAWTEAEISRFEAVHPIGTRARLALALLLYTGQRRSDIVLFGPMHMQCGWLHFTQQKNKDRRPVYLEIPIQEGLQAILDATPLGTSSFLVNAFGKPFTVAGFGNWFRSVCDKAELPQCTAHGLRKAAARRLAENGLSAHQIMAITGHSTLKEVDRYTRGANQRKLAGQAFGKS